MPRPAKTWTDDEVFALTGIAFMCGMAEAAGDVDFGPATIGPRWREFMPLLNDVLNEPSPAGKQKVLSLADVLNRHGVREVRTLIRDTKRYGREAARKRWRARTKVGA